MPYEKNVWYFPKGIFPSGNFLKLKFPKRQLPKSVIATALGTLFHPSRSARSPWQPKELLGVWEVATRESTHLGSGHLGNVHLESRPGEYLTRDMKQYINKYNLQNKICKRINNKKKLIFNPCTRTAVVHLNFQTGSTFPVLVCTVPSGHRVNKADT